MASGHAAIDHDVARNPTSAPPDHVAGAGQAFSKVARAPCQDDALCGQYCPTRKQCVRASMDLGSRGAQGWTERVCDSAGSIQIKARTRCHTERSAAKGAYRSCHKPGFGGVFGRTNEHYEVATDDIPYIWLSRLPVQIANSSEDKGKMSMARSLLANLMMQHRRDFGSRRQ